MISQPSLFADQLADEARLRARAWARCERLAVFPADPVERALAVEAMATARSAYDLTEFPADQLDPSGLHFLGEARGVPLLMGTR